MKNSVQKLKVQLRYFPRTIRLIWEASRWLMIAWGALLLATGLLPAFQISLSKPLIDGLARFTGSGLDHFSSLLLPLGLLAFTLIMIPILSSLLQWIRSLQNEKVQNSIRMLIQNKALSLEYSCFETPEYYDKLHRAHIDALSKPSAMLENLGLFVQNTLTLGALILLLLPLAWWLPIVFIFSSMPTLLIALKFTLKFHHWRLKHTASERRLNYLDHTMTSSDAAAELRVYKLGTYLQKIYWTLKAKIQNDYFSLINANLRSELIGTLFGFVVMALVIGWIVKQTLEGDITVGMLAMYFFAFTQGQKVAKVLLSNMSELYKNLMFLENLFDFLDLDIESVHNHRLLPPAHDYTIRFEDVTFSYPNGAKNALSNISLTLSPKKITAIVGTNGSGKSTLIKLINGFYPPNEGSIFINDLPLKQIDPQELRKNIAVLFQNFVHYQMNIAHNIGLGALDRNDLSYIRDAASFAGIDTMIQTLPYGYETLLGKWFGGIELSGGEWQKVALARAYLKDAKIVILDEPTSAMDSWAESDWINRFRTMCLGKTALIITHRFSTARHADIIHVMDGGQIVESGTHDELVAYEGLYARSWKNQTQEYSGANV